MISAPPRAPAPNAAVPLRTAPFSSAAPPRHKPKPRPTTIRCAAAAAAPPAPTTLYDVLGLRAGATVREIKAAYRRLARERHPDAAGAAAAAEFVRLHDAYATLSDPDSRARYDRAYARWADRPRRTWETDQCW